jgi:hypothetical protein
MSHHRVWPRLTAVVALLGLGLGVLASSPAAAAVKHPTATINAPVCVSGFDVALTGTVNWKTGPVGTVTVNWGDGNTTASAFPDWHVYSSSGTFTITLTASNSHGAGTDTSVVTVGPSSATCVYSVSPQPIAESGTLAAGQATQVVVKVTGANGKVSKKPVPVWLSFAATSGGGQATACCTTTGASVPIGVTPVALSTGGSEPAGEVIVSYTVSGSPPASGSDTVTVSPVPNAADTGSMSTSYQYSSSPVPLTPPASIAADCSVDVSKSLGTWMRNLPDNATVVPPPGACYQVDEGLALKFPVGLTVDGGTYENLSTAPTGSESNGTQRGDPVFNILGGSALTLENMTIDGANPGGYLAKMAFASGIQLQGTQGVSITNVNTNGTYGDGITLDPLRSGSDHKGSGIISPTTNADISNVTLIGPGRMGIAFVSVNGATVTNADISNVGLDTFDVEADQGDEGTENLTIDGCTASTTGKGDFFADGGASSGMRTGNITVSNCVMNEAQAGTVIWVNRPGTGPTPRGPYLFENDTFECGASTTVACVIAIGGTVTIDGSSFSFPPVVAPATSAETVYQAETSASIDFSNDDATGYGTTDTGDPGTVDATSTVTVSGGTWTPAS